MKIALYTAGAFVAGIFAGRWLMENTFAAEAAGEIAESKVYYEKKYQEQFEESVRFFVKKWEGDEAAEKLTFKNGQPQLSFLLKAEEVDPKTVTVEGVEYEVMERVKAAQAEGAASNEQTDALIKQGQLIEKAGYTSYNNLKPAPPTGVTASAEGVKGAYVISQEEFFDRGLDKQNQITYYSGNDTLVNAKGSVVPKEDRAVLIGLDTLSKFGELSEDDNVVYVRNPVIGAGVDFEITLDEGNYEA